MFFYRSEISQSCKGTFPLRACAAPRTPPLVQVEILNRVFSGISLPVRDPKCRFPRKTIKNGGLRRGGREEREEIPSPPTRTISESVPKMQMFFCKKKPEKQKNIPPFCRKNALSPIFYGRPRALLCNKIEKQACKTLTNPHPLRRVPPTLSSARPPRSVSPLSAWDYPLFDREYQFGLSRYPHHSELCELSHKSPLSRAGSEGNSRCSQLPD